MIWIAVIFVIAYLLGSVNTSIIVGRIARGDDIRAHGSGNAGTTNALRTYGKKAAVFVLLGDIMKAVLAVLAARLIAAYAAPQALPYSAFGGGYDGDILSLSTYIAGVGVVLGHNFPLYFGFKGGKGVLVSAVAIIAADWRIGLAALVFALLVMAVSRYVSLGSVLGAIFYLVCVALTNWGNVCYITFALLIAASVVIMHRANLRRVFAGTESKLGKKEA